MILEKQRSRSSELSTRIRVDLSRSPILRGLTVDKVRRLYVFLGFELRKGPAPNRWIEILSRSRILERISLSRGSSNLYRGSARVLSTVIVIRSKPRLDRPAPSSRLSALLNRSSSRWGPIARLR